MNILAAISFTAIFFIAVALTLMTLQMIFITAINREVNPRYTLLLFGTSAAWAIIGLINYLK